ncbi:McrB family protein [Ensifer adhaerens]|uniref:McrB family protein n=1 Tax=Ensifer adhaerens TaxID=106592 RepID=UPI001C4E0407|nr:AAA family ATPase [Ensifer adhaerens]MBW0369982.1 AAA family ATPase [Ensifer adhaerens]UCM19055.1 AAA family ATPase [Ensifer adhaerens]
MNDVVYSARKLAPSNLGWFNRTRQTLGEASGKERAININRDVFADWFPDRDPANEDPIEINTRFLDGAPGHAHEIRTVRRTIRLQGGGKNWRLAGDAVPGELYDVREHDLLLMAFDRSTSTLSFIVLKRDNQSSRPVAPLEQAAYSHVSAILGPDNRSMWIIPAEKAGKIIDITKTVYDNAGDVLMQYKSMAESWRSDLSSSGYAVVQSVDERLLLALFAKRFLILTGLSGSGKTLLARSFLRWCAAKPEQYSVVAVGANWTSNEHVLGYADALNENRYVRTKVLDVLMRAADNPEQPHFVILDEMNLSHVERYFADFLSAIESPQEPIHLHGDTKPREGVPGQLPNLPPNLFVIGTVNVDETTYMFSPKVLDRANVIEFRTSVEAMQSYLGATTSASSSIENKGSGFGTVLVEAQQKKVSPADLPEAIRKPAMEEILLLFNLLAEEELEFGFRSAHEIARYFWFAFEARQPATDAARHEVLATALDHQVLQKILPRIHGARKRVEPLLLKLRSYCQEAHEWELAGIKNLVGLNAAIAAAKNVAQTAAAEDVTATPFLPLSHRKIERMLTKLKSTGFVSFAEG